MPVPVGDDGGHDRLHLGRGLLDLGLHAADLFLRFVALDGTFEGVFLAHGLDGLCVILVRQSFLDNRVKMSDGGLGKAFF